MNDDLARLAPLGAALAIGLLIGAERGWGKRDAPDGGRVAGVRTYGLLGLLGGVSATLGDPSGLLLVGVMFVGVAVVLVVAWRTSLQVEDDIGITSLIAALLTYALGAMAARGMIVPASAVAVVTMLLLAYKPHLHRALRALDWQELKATVQLLLLTVVVLPVIPNRAYGPWSAINPFELWWMVVLMATLSFTGHFVVRLAGGERGMLFTGLFGGLASSSAATLHFARLARDARATDAGATPAPSLLATSIVLANLTMLPRMLLLAGLISVPVARAALLPALAMFAVLAAAALLQLRAARGQTRGSAFRSRNPLSLGTALASGLLLAGVLVAGRGLQETFGGGGVLGLAAISGVASIDAIALSLGRLSEEGLGTATAALGLLAAAAVNQVAKTVVALAVGGRALGTRVAVPLLLSAVAGPLAAWPLWAAPR